MGKQHKQNPSIGKSYVTVEEATYLLNVAERTVRRMIAQKKLEVIRDSSGFVRIDVDAIEKLNALKPRQAHPILSRIEALEEHVTMVLETLEDLKKRLEGLQIPQGLHPPMETHTVPSQSAAERRGFPVTTLRLVDFAKEHEVTVGTIKSFYEKQEIALTVYQRTGYTTRNKQEWWVSSEQHAHIAKYLSEHHVPFMPCPCCVELI